MDNTRKIVDAAAPKTDHVQFILIRIGGSLYAIDIMKIVEIVKYAPVTRIPKAPEFLEGVIDLRGAIVPVVDMRKRFEIQAERPDDTASENGTDKIRIVIVKVMDKTAGLVVDEVKEVLKVAPGRVVPAPKIAQGVESEYLQSVLSDRGRIILVLDLDKILTTTERIQLKNLVLGEKKHKSGGNR